MLDLNPTSNNPQVYRINTFFRPQKSRLKFLTVAAHNMQALKLNHEGIDIPFTTLFVKAILKSGHHVALYFRNVVDNQYWRYPGYSWNCQLRNRDNESPRC